MDRLGRIVSHLSPAPAGRIDGGVVPTDTGLNALTHSITETERHGGQIVAEILKAHRVEHVFTLVGGHISPILVASEERGIKIVDVRHEVTAVFAADAMARLTGIPGVAAVTAGPGITNTMTAIVNAKLAQSPVVLLGGAAATLLRGRGSLQDIDHLSFMRPVCKYVASVSRVMDLVPTLRRAFSEAMSGVPGPVFVEIPLDVLYTVNEVRASMGLAERVRRRDIKAADVPRVLVPDEAAKGGVDAYLASKRPDAPVFLAADASKPKNPKVVELFLRYKLASIFAGGFPDNVDYSPLPISIPHPLPTDISRTLALLAKAKRPVLLIGSQAMIMAPKAHDLQKAVQHLGLPTFLGGMARGLLGRNSPLHIRQNRGDALKKADFVIMAGITPDFRLDYGRTLSSKSTIVAVNRSRDDLKLNTDLFWSPALAVNSDACIFLLELAAKCGPPGKHAAWTRSLKEGEEKKEAANAKKAQEPAYGHDSLAGKELVNPLRLCEQLEAILPDDSILVADGGDFVATASYILRPRGPLCWLDPGAFGTLGVGGGFALAAKLARPSAQVWLIYGDGSSGYSLAEVDTELRLDAPVIALIGNDSSWTQIEREQQPIFGRDTACKLRYTPYEDVGRGYGGDGLTIKGPEDDTASILRNAQELERSGRPVVVNALIGATNFREGSLSV